MKTTFLHSTSYYPFIDIDQLLEQILAEVDTSIRYKLVLVSSKLQNFAGTYQLALTKVFSHFSAHNRLPEIYMNMAPNLDSFEYRNTEFDVSESGESKSESAEGTVHSDITSEYIPSETSEDRSFVASDPEEQP